MSFHNALALLLSEALFFKDTISVLNKTRNLQEKKRGWQWPRTGGSVLRYGRGALLQQV